MQVSAADCRSGAPHDRIVRLLDLPLGNIIEADIANLVPNDGSHGSLHWREYANGVRLLAQTDAWLVRH